MQTVGRGASWVAILAWTPLRSFQSSRAAILLNTGRPLVRRKCHFACRNESVSRKRVRVPAEHALDARNFFDPPKISGLPSEPIRRLSRWPIRKDRTFFFGAYEGIRQARALGRLDVVPSLDAAAPGRW